jgi:hypothetical protein
LRHVALHLRHAEHHVIGVRCLLLEIRYLHVLLLVKSRFWWHGGKDAEPIIPPDMRKKPRRPVNSNVKRI